MTYKSLIKLVFFILLCQLAGIIGAVFTLDAIPNWYAALNKPPFSPPNWIFGPVWTALYTLMGISLYIVWKKGLKNKKINFAFKLFLVHLVINALWSVIFFETQNPSLAFFVIVVLWILIAWLISLFYKINKAASYLLIPYLAWVSFATVLNYFIWKLN